MSLKKWVRITAIFILGYIAALYSIINSVPPVSHVRAEIGETAIAGENSRRVEEVQRRYEKEKIRRYNAAYIDVSSKAQVECPNNNKDLIVLFTFGQSNGANRKMEEEKWLTPSRNVINLFQGKCYVASDPMLGADGEGASVWLSVGDELINAKAAKQVLVRNFALGGSSISEWIPGGGAHRRLVEATEDIKSVGLTPTHILWFQGESDATKNTNQQQYESAFSQLTASVRSLGLAAPILVSKTTVCKNYPNAEIRAAQANIPTIIQGVYSGPDTDKLGFTYRFDGCHFTAEGRGIVAKEWAAKILAVGLNANLVLP